MATQNCDGPTGHKMRDTDDGKFWYGQLVLEQTAHHQTIRDLNAAVESLRRIRYELAALTHFPDKPDFLPACPNPADAKCVALAYAETDEYRIRPQD